MPGSTAYVGERGSSVRGQGVAVLGRVDVEHAARGDAEVETVEQVRVAAFGHDDLAVGVRDVARQLRTATRSG